ncbi:hypothetical protein [Rhizobium sp. P007]|uniref:hypothetical protein n=1 Tax=Rhizobium sp. P007 TaxID=285908 RepID=UPI001156CD15|nr:hypothetical protein [Rhizobium sp. P007]CAD7041111.1 hypothetical protein RP007_00709 [Rhizobium sp. P007]
MDLEREPSSVTDLKAPVIWIAALSKAMVKKGLLTKEDIVEELIQFGRHTDRLDAEIAAIIDNVRKW